MSVRFGFTIVAVLLSFATVPASAQQFGGGVKFGVALGSVSNLFVIAADAGEDDGASSTLAFGGFVHAGGERIAFQPELLLTSYVADLDGAGEDDTATDIGHELVLRYLELPLLLRLKFPSSGNAGAYMLAGPNFGFTTTSLVRTTIGDGEPEAEDIGDRVAGSNVGLTVGAGLQGRRWLIEGRWTSGLSNIAEDNDADRVRTRTFTILLGLRF